MNESVLFVLKYAGYAMGILLAVFIIAVLTPKLAALVDKIRAKYPERVKDNKFPDVRGIYDVQPPLEKKENKDDNGDVENGGK